MHIRKMPREIRVQIPSAWVPRQAKYSYASYRGEWKKFANTIIAAVPDVKFGGPGVHNNSDWVRRFLADFGNSNHVSLVTAHLYPGGAGAKVPTPRLDATECFRRIS